MPESKTYYTCNAGDNWGGIAFKLWQDEMQMHRLIAANPLYSDVLTFEGGERLLVPDGVGEASVVDTSSLPPWAQ